MNWEIQREPVKDWQGISKMPLGTQFLYPPQPSLEYIFGQKITPKASVKEEQNVTY